ncbi:MAG: hypothetical protein QOA57_02475 [Nitrososphaeraceae archaeon]|nr:hypothetical protein [Nitrososphaeraceae archaeon]MDW0183475.1 hypothetical protein [Nitrososphaeraceae archaeon]MDW0196017.1 hypothetical protein [Nitrososphaeraceae archaeon]MDW0213307.1 hypothetical protein [Nitrososphaeraceae archaeon]MDW0254487.1 hypothetical protein [Nitrososphaeraceae archaeon]
MRKQCEAGACSADCSGGCGCISWGKVMKIVLAVVILVDLQ